MIPAMFKLIGRLIGLAVAIPLAVVALILYPVVWLVLLPLKIVGGAVNGTLGALRSLMGMPGRVVKGKKDVEADD